MGISAGSIWVQDLSVTPYTVKLQKTGSRVPVLAWFLIHHLAHGIMIEARMTRSLMFFDSSRYSTFLR